MNDIISITSLAWETIHNNLNSSGGRYNNMKVDITTRGCSGFSYVFDYDNNGPNEDDFFIEEDGHMVIITERAAIMVSGATLDYIEKDKFTKIFDFINENETSRCGCGESFNI